MGPSLAGKNPPRISPPDVERNAKIDELVKWLIVNDPQVKKVHDLNPFLGLRKAMAIAAAKIPPRGGGFGNGQADVARSQGDAKIPDKKGIIGASMGSRDEKLQKRALSLLGSNSRLRQMAVSDDYSAYKEALKIADRELRAGDL
jgi:hypothetical protein